MSNLAPGTYVQETNFPTYTDNTPTDTLAVFIGAHNQGPLTQHLVQSWPQFVALYGGFTGVTVPSSLALAVFCFFANGGGQCYVIRVVHIDAVIVASSAAPASATLTAADLSQTLQVVAGNPGAWGNSLMVQCSASGPTGSGRFNLGVFQGTVATAQTMVEPLWTNLSMDPADSFYAPAVINNPLNGSTFVTVVDLAVGGATGQIPAFTPAAIPLGTGVNSKPGVDGSPVTSADLVATSALLDQIPNPMVLNFPGISDVTNVLSPVLTYITQSRPFPDSVLICDTQPGQNVQAAIVYAGRFPTSSYAAMYYPWVTVSDPASAAPGALRTVPPGAFVMGQMALIDASRGVQKATAGVGTGLAAIGPERFLSQSDIGALTNANINAIRFLRGAGTVIWGARTLSNIQSTRYLNIRRVLIYVEAQIKSLCNYAVFEDNDWVLWNQLSMRINTFLNRFWAGGGLAGTTATAAFYVICNATNNTAGSGTTNIAVGVAPTAPAEFILINVGQWQGGVSVIESTSAASLAISR